MFVMMFAFFHTGCSQRLKRGTIELKCHFYVETFNVNPFGVDEDYLTDSLNFRMFVGKYDVEHETFTYVCKEDSLIIYKKAEDTSGKWKKVDSLHLSKEYFIENKADSSKPLFKFK